MPSDGDDSARGIDSLSKMLPSHPAVVISLREYSPPEIRVASYLVVVAITQNVIQ